MKRIWIAFDAADTLFETFEPVENVYARCFEKLGYSATPSLWKSAFRKAFVITPEPVYVDSESGEETEKNWWHRVVRACVFETGISPSTEDLNTAFEELFAHYASGAAWKLFPETEQVLKSLSTARTKMAVTSNFDSRLHQVLVDLDISKYFEKILTSADVGARKPSPRILEKLMREFGISKTDLCLVGDSAKADGGAAEAVGIPFFHLIRPNQNLSNFLYWHQTHKSAACPPAKMK
ncbi:MAG: HAD-IA family hydrolase [Akkermansiaceae bacterium]